MELIWITAVRVLDGYNLHLTFNNGKCKVFDFSQVLSKDLPIFEPLKNISVFRNIKLDGWTVTWLEGEIDIAPEYLYENGVTL